MKGDMRQVLAKVGDGGRPTADSVDSTEEVQAMLKLEAVEMKRAATGKEQTQLVKVKVEEDGVIVIEDRYATINVYMSSQ